MASTRRNEPLQKAAAAVVSVAMVVVVVSPVFAARPKDSFPLSTFPMFSNLIEPEVEIDTVVGVDLHGVTVRLDPETIAGTDEVIIAGSIVSQAVGSGPDAVARLCSDVSQRVRAGRAPDGNVLDAIEVRTETVDAIAHFSQRSAVVSSIVHTRCEISE